MTTRPEGFPSSLNMVAPRGPRTMCMTSQYEITGAGLSLKGESAFTANKGKEWVDPH